MSSHRDDSLERPLGSTLGPDIAAHVEAIVHAAEREARAAERAIEDRRRSAEEEVQRYLAAARLHVDAETAARAARLESLSSAARRLADELSDAAAALTTELRRDDETMRPRTPWRSVAPRDPAASRRAPEAAAPPPSAGDAAPAVQPTVRDAAAPPQPGPAPHVPVAPAAAVASSQPAPLSTWARADELPADPFPADPFGAPAPAATATRSAVAAAPAELPNAARLVAIEMAVGGASRAEVEAHLLDQFGIADPAPLLDDVFGSESHASTRLAWGEP